MNTTNPSLFQGNAHDALFERIERELCALTIAPLDAQPSMPRQSVDEFADDCLVHFALPPARRRFP
ncbi:hypothetical protein [uncultured Massilia sp.]|uniref:hypothetical protein n=1 Tax=uncultured Massilia sp. TaxID=169973 RepID=UPI0025E99DE5|nr:hypothetical protein [uncultured Massilia sp.]